MDTTIDPTDVKQWKRYQEYRTTGNPSYPTVPSGWHAMRLKWLLVKVGSGKTPRGGGDAYTDSGVMFLRSQNVHFGGLILDDVVYIDENTDGEMAGSRVNGNDVLLNITGASLGRCSLVPTVFPSANVNQHVCILRPRPTVVSPSFLNAAIASSNVQSQIFSSENGISREGLNFEQTANLVIALPKSLPEQRAIAAFLDRETARIDALIGHKQRLIALLEEKRQAVISHAATKGLDPNAVLTRTQNDWVTRVPSHWIITRLGFYTTRIGDGLHGTPEYMDTSDICFINGNNLRGGEIVDTATTRKVDESEYQKHKVLLDNSTLLLSINGTIGSVAFYRGQKIILSKSAAYINCSNDLDRDFLYYFLQSSTAQNAFLRYAGGTTIPNLSLESIRKAWIVLPPLDEQRAIVTYLNVFVDKIHEAEAKVRESVEQLKEYRTALISAAVTGQIDVREEVQLDG